MQEVDHVITERNSLQQQLAALSSAHETETAQLHQDKATLQVSFLRAPLRMLSHCDQPMLVSTRETGSYSHTQVELSGYILPLSISEQSSWQDHALPSSAPI